MKLIEVCDFLMVENVDVLVDKIVEKFGVSIMNLVIFTDYKVSV
jgi:putative transposon-encoded protein